MAHDALQPDTHTTLQPGEKLGHYRVVEQIGAGGMSVVHRGHDDLLDRAVAIKHVRLTSDGDADESALRRRVRGEAQLQRQAAAAAPDRLVQPIEVVDEPRGLFIVTELVDGLSLEQELTRSPAPMDLRRAVGIIAAIAQGLDAIHQHRIIHRDLKPANILLPQAGGLKIADFGLATAMSEQRLQNAGSVRYMAPELLRGDDADGRADLYALGLIAYEMIVGRQEFEQAFRMILRDQRNQAMRWVKWHTNPRVKATPLCDARPDVPEAIGALVDRLMEKEADRRVPTAGDVIDAIRRHYTGGATASPTAGAPGSPPATATTPAGDTAPVPRRSRMPLVLAGVLAIPLVLAGGVGAFLLNEHRTAERERAQQALAALEQAGDAFRDGDYELALERYAEIAGEWDRHTDPGRHAAAGMLLARGRLYLEEGDYAQAQRDLHNLADMQVLDPDRVRRLLDETERRIDFADAMSAIDQRIADAEFTDARRQLRDWRDVDLTRDEEQRLNELSARLEDQRAQHEREQVLTEVDRLVERGDRNEAIERLAALLDRVPSVTLQERYDQLVAAQRVDNLVSRARAAETGGDLERAVELYSQAQQIAADDALQRELNALRSRAELERGLELLERGRTDEAEAALLRSLRYDDNDQARAALERIESTSRRQSFIADGDDAFDSGDYDAAIQQYRNALELESGDDVRQRLQRARLHQLLGQTHVAIDERELEAAAELLDELERVAEGAEDADDAAMVAQARQSLENHRQYHAHMTAGDAARAASELARAKREYRAARDILDTEQVRQRLNETEFADAISKARAHLAMNEYEPARAWLAVAARYRPPDDEEVTRLQQRINEAVGGDG